MRKKYVLAKRFMELCGILPIQRKAVFTSYFGKYYNCSPKAIYEAMRKQMPDCKYVWLMKDASTPIEGAKVVRPDTWSALYHLATAALWVDNARKPIWTVKRPGKQYYVNTGHSSFALKKVEKDVEDRLNKAYIRSAKHDSEMLDLLLSASKWRSETILKKSYWYDGEVLEYGLPRSDIFFQDGSGKKESVYRYYGQQAGTKMALYAPTFRNSESLSMYLSTEECEAVLNRLAERFGGEWKLIVRLHPNIAEKQGFIQYSDRIMNGSAYSDINDLIIASELMITDYSGCMYDAMEAGKKVFLYATDIEEYTQERGFYFALDELPFPLASSMDEFARNIASFDENKYIMQVEQFAEKIGSFNNAHASERVAAYLIRQMQSRMKHGKK